MSGEDDSQEGEEEQACRMLVTEDAAAAVSGSYRARLILDGFLRGPYCLWLVNFRMTSTRQRQITTI